MLTEKGKRIQRNINELQEERKSLLTGAQYLIKQAIKIKVQIGKLEKEKLRK